jgi:long-chain fatty acid transport protein
MSISAWKKFFWTIAAVCGLSVVSNGGVAHAAGLALSGVGPINRAMGGAATAAPIDAGGALHWNPASISGLPTSEVLFGMELILPTEEISSSIPNVVSDTTRGEPGVAPVPSIAWVHKHEGSRLTYGLGMYGIAGYRVNYPSDPGNPILANRTLFADVQLLQIAPTVAYALTDKLSIGFAPTLTLAQVMVDPMSFADPANGVYPSGQSTRYAWGGGAQLGIYYITDNCWHLGFSIKSPQWMEDFRYNTVDANGDSQVVKVDIDYPLILSLGLAYTGWENLLVALDVRYFDYANTNGFRKGGFNQNGALQGLDWPNLFSMHLGTQYRMSERMYLRAGYAFNESPISSGNMAINIVSPLMIQHIVSIGMSYQLTSNVIFSATYLHGFENSITGDLLGPVPPGSTVGSKISADALSVGFTIRY